MTMTMTTLIEDVCDRSQSSHSPGMSGGSRPRGVGRACMTSKIVSLPPPLALRFLFFLMGMMSMIMMTFNEDASDGIGQD